MALPSRQEPAAPEAGEATQAPEAAAPTEEPEAEPSGEVQDFVTWYQFDQDNEDPANDEAVGNAYLRDTIPQFNEAYDGKWNWVNVPKAWDKMPAELVAAVMAGGDVPDLMQAATRDMLNLVRNGDPAGPDRLGAGPGLVRRHGPQRPQGLPGQDGRLYCIPIAEIPYVTFVWADLFPNGYPTTPEEFLAEAERLKAEGHQHLDLLWLHRL